MTCFLWGKAKWEPEVMVCRARVKSKQDRPLSAILSFLPSDRAGPKGDLQAPLTATSDNQFLLGVVKAQCTGLWKWWQSVDCPSLQSTVLLMISFEFMHSFFSSRCPLPHTCPGSPHHALPLGFCQYITCHSRLLLFFSIPPHCPLPQSAPALMVHSCLFHCQERRYRLDEIRPWSDLAHGPGVPCPTFKGCNTWLLEKQYIISTGKTMKYLENRRALSMK